jgi:D-alanyl-D-alanine carboxypeptidase
MGRSWKRRAASFASAVLAALLVFAECSAYVSADQSGTASQTQSAAESAAADPSVVTSNAITGWPQGADVVSKCACLMDADTGAVLYSKGMNDQMYPASVTKIMTCLLALENGKLTDQVTMTQTGVAYVAQGSSNLSTQVGEVFTLEQMLYGMMLKSANDMATQVGEYIGGGSLDTFLRMMNDRAAAIGCTHTHFANACGMPDANHYTSAYDLALISQEALKNADFRTIVNTATYTIPATNLTAAPRSLTSHDPLLVSPDFYYPGIIGGKTGYTDLALNTLASFASRDGMTLIAVTLYAADGTASAKDNVSLLDYGFDHFQKTAVGKAEYNTEGGYITIPKGCSADDCDVREETSKDAGLGDILTCTYAFGGQVVVGKYVMTQANAKKYAEELAASKAAAESKAAADSKAAAASRAAASKAAAESAKASGTANSGQGAAAQSAGTQTGGIAGISGPAAVAIAVLSVFVLAGLVLVIAGIMKKRGRHS